MTRDFDVVVIGAGIAGASIAAHLAEVVSVCLLEMEDSPGYHSTGRSAALFSESYGNAVVRALTRASREFFFNPPVGFSDSALVKPKPVLVTATRPEHIEKFLALVPPKDRETKSVAEAVSLCPIIRSDMISDAVLCLQTADIDVNALLMGYLRVLKARGGEMRTATAVRSLEQISEGWLVGTDTDVLRSRTIVNAAGAWAGHVGTLARAQDLGLAPLKRTVCLVDPPTGMDIANWPMLVDAEDSYYLKPDAGQLLLSPCDEEPSLPTDAQPDELTIAVAAARIETATTLSVRRINHRWAGLRTFTEDRSPVIGLDRRAPGFFWHAGLGGYGIQTAPAISRLAAALLLNKPLNKNLQNLELNLETLSPARFN
jgi:D-arginine dehydrogenase